MNSDIEQQQSGYELCEEIAQYREAFSRYKNRDGKITTNQLESVMRALGKNLTNEELREMINYFNVRGNNVIDFTAFFQMMLRKLLIDFIKETVRAGFRVYDREHTGFISSAQLHIIMTNVARYMEITNAEIEEMIRDADVELNGQIDYEFFISTLCLDL